MRRLVRAGAVLALGLACSLGCGGGPEEPGRISGALSATDTYLVSWSAGTDLAGARNTVRGLGGTVLATYANVNVLLVRGDDALARTLRSRADVGAVGRSHEIAGRLTPPRALSKKHRPHTVRAPGADPLSPRQWDMQQIRSPEARAIQAGRPSVLVGVLDSGIDPTHPDLVGQVDAGASVSCVGGIPNADPAQWGHDILGHGTHVAGLIAAAKNGVGIVGVAPGVRVAAVKVGIDDVNDPNFGLVFADAFVCGVDWALSHHVDLMNASLSIDPFTGPIDDIFCSDQPDRAAVVTMVREALAAAARQQVTLIASVGNAFTDLASLHGATPGSTCQVLPGQLPRVIGVSSVGYTRSLAFYSNHGSGAVDLTAPGGDSLVPDPLVPDTAASGQVLSSVPADSLYYQAAADWDGQVEDCSSGTCATYAYLQGASQAVPHVTGVAALAVSRFGRMAPEVLQLVLSLGARHLACPSGPYDPGMTGSPATCEGSTFFNSFYGAGEVDALNVVR